MQTMNRFPSLEEKTIVIVGAGGRIGREITAAALAAGARVVAVDCDDTALSVLSNFSGSGEERLLTVKADITNVASIERMLSLAHDRFGVVSGAVNTAYPRNPNYGRPFFEVEFSDFSENLSLHLGGYFLFMQQCAKYAINMRNNFSLVNLSSIYGVMAPRFEVYEKTSFTMPVEYAAIKSAIIHLTKYASAYAGEYFRANCVSPGGILAGQDDSFLQRYNTHCMRKGMLSPNDVTGSIVFLLSDVSEFVVGQNIIVDDGFAL